MSDQPEKKGKGCFFYGCLTVVVLTLLVGGLVVLGVWKVRSVVRNYTDTQPTSFRPASISPEELAKCQLKCDAFMKAVKAGQRPAQLALSAKEINALIQNRPDLAPAKDKLEVSFDGDRATGRVSIPLDQLMPGIGKGRYLNGAASFKIACDNGLLLITFDALSVKGRPVPETFMSEMRKVNLAEELYKNPENIENLKRVKSIRIQNGTLIIEALPKTQ